LILTDLVIDYGQDAVAQIGKRNLYRNFFSVQKGGPPKIGGAVQPNTSNMAKAGPAWKTGH